MRGVELVIAAGGVVVAEGDVDGDAGEGGAQAGDDIGCGFFGEGDVVGVGGGGEEGLVLAVEGVSEEISADGDEADSRGVGVDGVKTGLP